MSRTNSNPIMLFMLDARKDPTSIKGVYDKLVSEGVALDDSFLQHLNHTLLKYSETVPFEMQAEAGSPQEVHVYKGTSILRGFPSEKNIRAKRIHARKF